jgi:hypothetical protein
MGNERYFLNRVTGRLFVDRHFPRRFTMDAERYRELKPEEYAALRAVHAQFLDSMKPWAGRRRGETIHVFGNGPSLLNFAARQDWTGRVTLGVNAAGLHIRPLRYWLSADNLAAAGHRDLYDWIQRWLASAEGVTTTFARFGSPLCLRGCTDLLDARRPWLPDAMFTQAPDGPAERIDEGLYWDGASVHAALDLARHFGCRRAILWGVDYHDRSHSYTHSREIPSDPGDQPGRPWTDFEKIARGFERLRRACAARGMEVFNANPESRLKVFPFIPPQTAFGAPCEDSAATPSPAQTTRLFMLFTAGTLYEVLAQEGVAAFARCGLAVEAVAYPNLGNWMLNALARAPRLDLLAAEHPGRAVGLLDAEVRPLARPGRLFSFDGDLAVEDRGPGRPPHDRYSAGVLLFGATALGRRLLRDWAQMCKANPEPQVKLREQKYLHDCIEKLKPLGLDVTNLGNAYNRLPEQRRAGDSTVLLHEPASRRMLAQIGGTR